MSVTVKGIPVRSNELTYEIAVKFEDLNSKGQKRLFLENKDIFLADTITSRYASIRKLSQKFKSECSSETLNNLIYELTKSASFTNVNLVLSFLNVEHLELDPELRESLSQSDYWAFRLWVAEDKNTSLDILTNMFKWAATDFIHRNYSDIFDAIVQNPNFKLNNDLKTLISHFSIDSYSKIMSRIKELSEIRNE